MFCVRFAIFLVGFSALSLPAEAIPVCNSSILRIDYTLASEDKDNSMLVLWYKHGHQGWIRGKSFQKGDPLNFVASDEGVYSFIIKYADDTSLPNSSDTIYRCLVDFSKPVLQISFISFEDGKLTVKWRAYDKYFADRPIEIYLLKSLDEQGKFLGRFSNNGYALISIDKKWFPAKIKLLAVDRAGNYAVDISETIFAETKKILKPAPATKPASTQPVQKIPPLPPEPHIPLIQAVEQYQLGRKCRLTGQMNLAKIHYKRSIELDPKYINPQIDLADVFRSLGEYNKSAVYYLKAIKTDSNNVIGWQGLARVRIQQGMYKQAKQCLKKVIEMDDKNIPGWIYLGDAEWMLGEKSESSEAWLRAKKLIRDGKFSKLEPTIASRLKLIDEK